MMREFEVNESHEEVSAELDNVFCRAAGLRADVKAGEGAGRTQSGFCLHLFVDERKRPRTNRGLSGAEG